MNQFTDEQIKEVAKVAAHRYFAQDESMEAFIESINIEDNNDDEATVCINWDYEDRDEDTPPPDTMIFTVSVVRGDDGDELHIHGPEF